LGSFFPFFLSFFPFFLSYFLLSSSFGYFAISMLIQIGSGKTHTLLGSAKEEGIMQKSARYLFDTIAALTASTTSNNETKTNSHNKSANNKSNSQPQVTFSVYFTVMCVLNEELYDLFNNNEIQIKYTRSGQLDISSSHGTIDFGLRSVHFYFR
jgi:hypothetical protein